VKEYPKTILSTIASKKQNRGVNLTMVVNNIFYNENCKLWKKEIKA
jgi:hypothetical protein